MNVFKSTEGREKIRKFYNQILSLFPIKQKYVNTTFGKTFVLEMGNEKNTPIILLHGSCSNSASWLGDMATLAEHYHVFAVDTLGEPGNSDAIRLDINTNDYPNWLKEVLDALKIEKAVIAGNSLGGWLALHFSVMYSERTIVLVLLASSGIIPPKQSFIHQTADITSNTDSAKATIKEVMGGTHVPKEVLEFMNLVMENFNPITEELPILKDKEMLLLTMPVLYIAGTNDVTMDTRKAASRLIHLLPHIHICLTENEHVITSAAKTIISFLSNELK